MMKRTVLIALVTCLLLAACGGGSASPTALVSTVSKPTPTRLTITTPTPEPKPETVVIVTPKGADPQLAQTVNSIVSGLAQADGRQIQAVTELQPADLQPEMKIVVFVSAPQNLADLAGQALETQFIVVGAGVEAKGNISVIQTSPEAQAFAAGYLAALAAPDWRVGGIFVEGQKSIQDAFANGVYYHCGRCAPFYAPIVLFPVLVSRPQGASPGDVQAAFNELQKNVLNILFVTPGLASAEALKVVEDARVNVLGIQPPPDTARERWAATVQFDVATPLKQVWSDIKAGKSGLSVAAGLMLTDVNEKLVSKGRQAAAQQVFLQLVNGMINPVTPP